MKKMALFFIMVFLLAIAGRALAAAQLDRRNVRSTENGGHLIAPILVSGDDNTVTIDMSAEGERDKKLFEGLLLWSLKVSPGADDAAPATAIDVTIACDGWSFTWTGLSNTAISMRSIYDADTPPTTPPMVTSDITITVSNLGSGNTATIKPIFW